MPNEKVLLEKQQYVAELKEKLSNAAAGVLVDYKGITVADDTKLRKELREAGVEYRVVKNTMLRLALKDTPYEEISSVLENTTAIAISNDDPIVAAKIICKYIEDNKNTSYAVKAGFADGKPMDKAGVETLCPNCQTKKALFLCCSVYLLATSEVLLLLLKQSVRRKRKKLALQLRLQQKFLQKHLLLNNPSFTDKLSETCAVL